MDTQPQTPPAPVSVSPPPSSQPEHVGGSKWPFIALGLLLLLLVFIGGFLLLNRNSKSTTPTTTNSQNQEDSAPASTDQGMKTYTNKKLENISFLGYTLQHPQDWVEKVERNDTAGTGKLTLEKDGYLIVIQQGPMDGSQCVYKDSEKPSEDESTFTDKRGRHYVDIKASLGNLRRDQSGGTKEEIGHYFCQEVEDSPGTYGSMTDVGSIYYNGPGNWDPEMLLEMDAIVKSIKTL